MATIALSRPVAPHRASSVASSATSSPAAGAAATTTTTTTTITLDTHPTPASRPVPVPNKHIPVCPPGPIPQQEPTTPPPSPQKEDEAQVLSSLLFPPDKYPCEEMGHLRIYKIDADDVAAAVDHLARQPMPDPSLVFPWLHGLHPANPIQQAFFVARKRSLRRTPPCLRGITLVKADGDLNVSRLKGAIAPQEFLQPASARSSSVPEFLDVDPKEGFSVRNFHIQPAKSAMTSDIVVYGTGNPADDEAARTLAWDIAAAQQRWRDRHEAMRHPLPRYNTFLCTSRFSDFEDRHPHLVSVNSAGLLTGQVVDFFHQERREMYEMTRASEISHNVWLGPTPEAGSAEEQAYDVLIECSDAGRLNPAAVRAVAELPDDESKQYHIEFPSSGSILPPSWPRAAEADAIVDACRWIYNLAHGTRPAGPSPGALHADPNAQYPGTESDPNDTTLSARPRKVLLHCSDGYTETTMLAVAYHAFATGQPIPDAWLDLHVNHRRNMFAYPSDVALLTTLAPGLLRASPRCPDAILSLSSDEAVASALQAAEPRWFAAFDGSFPSRVLDHLYLGNLGHANNPDLLRALGIGQMLSVGETAMWREGDLEDWGEDNLLTVRGVQDNGIDELGGEFERCLGFLERGLARNTATLVHCRVGVSRSATICIAEVMRRKRMSFPRAYCFVRARRLNVIIQPHLRFVYELLKWEERELNRPLSQGGYDGDDGCDGVGRWKRELEWAEIAREIALMNRPYAR
ncbi:hypothetical protein VTJ83DRAFT_6322 [Remersonia thermophila]|uniref:Protein-tyrosine-phosphatase n=1 Tax=Remersonia thermophila TaxID=72144 RepID=A0ABR4D4C0_9PEZI